MIVIWFNTLNQTLSESTLSMNVKIRNFLTRKLSINLYFFNISVI